MLIYTINPRIYRQVRETKGHLPRIQLRPNRLYLVVKKISEKWVGLPRLCLSDIGDKPENKKGHYCYSLITIGMLPDCYLLLIPVYGFFFRNFTFFIKVVYCSYGVDVCFIIYYFSVFKLKLA